MKELVDNFAAQLKEAIGIGNNAQLRPAENEIKNVLIAGLGGSGIGGTIASELTASTANVPVCVTKGYFPPEHINLNSLVIVSSYSGNTEETLNVLEKVIEKDAKIVCVTSGGKIEEIAKAKNLDLIKIPGEMPPRACLGYSLTQLFVILRSYGIIPKDSYTKELNDAISLLESEKENIKSEAKTISEKLYGKTPVIYTTTYKEGVAIRFRQQINENAKMLCWHHVFPEMNHNELVGWRSKNDNLAVVILRDHEEYSRNVSRFEISKGIISNYTSTIIELFSKGNSDLERALYLIHLCDWISVYLADLNKVDAVEVKVIDHLKGELSKR